VVEAAEQVAVPVAHLGLPFAGVRRAGLLAIGVGGEDLGPSTSCSATNGAAAVWMHSKRWLARMPGIASRRCWCATYHASHAARRAESSSAISTM